MQNRLESLLSQWEDLVAKSAEKSDKLKEASRQQTYNAGVKDIDFWLGEVRDVEIFVCRILSVNKSGLYSAVLDWPGITRPLR